MNKSYCVYKHILPKEISGKNNDMVYIGITSQKPERRWANGLGYTYNSYFYRAIQKYGWDNFVHEILFSGLTLNEANRKEIGLIELYNSTDRSCGYNLQTGGRNAGSNNPNYGNTKRVICLDTNEVYSSVKEVSEKFGLSTTSLYMNCTGKTNRCGGFRFGYLD